MTPSVLTVRVEGLARSGSACRAIGPSTLYVSLQPGPQPGQTVQIEHREEVDAYVVAIEETSAEGRAWTLNPVRESVTRLRPPETGE